MKRLLFALGMLAVVVVPAFADEACDAPRSPIAKVQADFAEQNATMRQMPDDMAKAAIAAYRQATGDNDTVLDSAYLTLNADGDAAVVVLADGACAVKMSKVVPLRLLPMLLGGKQIGI